jgi:hypothetical protein
MDMKRGMGMRIYRDKALRKGSLGKLTEKAGVSNSKTKQQGAGLYRSLVYSVNSF